MPDLIFPDHALERMQQRGIVAMHIYQVVEDADTIIEREDGRTEYFGLLADGRELIVVIEDDGTSVVSVMVRNQRRLRRR
jgi:hypothetical protein